MKSSSLSTNLSALGQAERLVEFKQIGDPLADAAVADLSNLPKEEREQFLQRILNEGATTGANMPESWRRLLEQMEHVPYWVDWKTLNKGSRAFLRAGGVGMFALSCYVTPLFYCLSNGNKALSFSGNLTKRAARRGRETARFVIETCLPGNLQRHGDGFKITFRVRLMHAQMRRMIAQSGRWDYERYGVPINQVYMASMMSLLSGHWVEGLKHLGLRLTADEEEGVMQLWRYSSYLIGVDPELGFATRQEALRYYELASKQDPPPDDDARELVRSILVSVPEVMGMTGKSARRMEDFCEGLAVSMMGAQLADQLELKRTYWRHFPHLSRCFIPVLDTLGNVFPPAKRLAQFHGTKLWLSMAEFPPQGGLEMFAAARSQADDTAHFRKPA